MAGPAAVPAAPVRRVRPGVSLLATAVLLAGVGWLAAESVAKGQQAAERLRREGRAASEQAAARGGRTGIGLSLKGTFDQGQLHDWSAAPGDPGDLERLRESVGSLHSFGYVGGMVLGLDLVPRTSYSVGPPLPPLDDPGYSPMLAALRARSAGPTDVLHAGPTPVVGFPAPILSGASPIPKAILVLFVDLERSAFLPAQLERGATDGRSALVDGKGVVVASSEPGLVGRPFPPSPGLDHLLHGHQAGFHEFSRGGTGLVTSYAPVEGGWGTISEQPTAQFFGPIRSTTTRTRLSLLALLGAALLAVAVLAHRRARAMEAVARQAYVDPMTGLPNAMSLERHLDGALERARRSRVPVHVLFCDLDRFKPINDTLGHAAGDRVLRVVAERLRVAVRSMDFPARVGGDEFVVVVEGVAAAPEVESIARRVIDAVGEPLLAGDREVYVGVSVGIAEGDLDGDSPGELVRRADLAMYLAKDLGGSRASSYRTELGDVARDELELEIELRAALGRDELRLHYQPVVDAATSELRAVEALLRWEHPSQGLLLPDDFLPLAERTRLIVPIGGWVLREACRYGARLVEEHGGRAPTVAVNVSLAQLGDGAAFVAEVAAALGDARLDPGRLTIEIVENALASKQVAALRPTLEALVRLGVTLAVDDFGTGATAVASLACLPLAWVKLDRSLVAQAGGSTGRRLLASLVYLGRALKLEVVAEGVETPEQAATMRDFGCTRLQGYLFGRPAPAPGPLVPQRD